MCEVGCLGCEWELFEAEGLHHCHFTTVSSVFFGKPDSASMRSFLLRMNHKWKENLSPRGSAQACAGQDSATKSGSCEALWSSL